MSDKKKKDPKYDTDLEKVNAYLFILYLINPLFH